MNIARFLHFHFQFSPQTSGELLLFKHMLATPLTSIQLCVQDSSTAPEASQLQTRHLEKNLAVSVQRINDIFYFFTNSENLSKESFTLTELITNIAHLFADSQGMISICYLENEKQKLQQLQLHGNKFLLEEALLCLIKNSLEAYSTNEKKHVKVTLWKRQDALYISIKDYGWGMSTWQKIFCQFPYISFKKFGSGIGLPFARYVIEKLYEGKLIITSIPNLGTEVVCIIPVPPAYTQTHARL